MATKVIGKVVTPDKHKAAWKASLSASHRGARPGKQRVQVAPKTPSWKVKF